MGPSSRAHVPASMSPLRHGSYFDEWKIIAGTQEGDSGVAESAESPSLIYFVYRAGGNAYGAVAEIPEKRRPAARRRTAPSAAATQHSAGAMSRAPWSNRKFASAATISPRAGKRLF